MQQAQDDALTALGTLTTPDARRHAHAAVLEAMQGDQHGLSGDVLAGAARNGHLPDVAAYLVALTGWALSELVALKVGTADILPATRHLLTTLERTPSDG